MIVYFIKPVGMDGPIKIGTSQSPDGRLSTLQTWSPFALEMVACIEGEGNIEGRFHAAFKKHHQRREWFTPADEIKQAIRDINAGRFDLSSLPEPIKLQLSGRKGKKLPIPDRYRSSVLARLRGAGIKWHQSQPILADATEGTFDLFRHRAKVERRLDSLGCNRSPIDWDALA